MLSYVIPTHDRAERLADTLAAIGRLDPSVHAPVGGAEIVIVDNGSAAPVTAPRRLANGIDVTVLRRPTNEGAAGRNAAVEAARGAWVFMLDDDSHPEPSMRLEALADAPAEIVAIGAEIRLPDGRREAGGLPEVIVGCGAAVRRAAFLDAGGYDPAFGYYVEEYDLSARLLAAGGTVAHDRRLRVVHHRAAAGRDMDVILGRLVRNNGWVVQRYAPDARLAAMHARSIERCREIALVEDAWVGFEHGLRELEATIDAQPRRPLECSVFDRFTGIAAVRTAAAEAGIDGRPVALVSEAKNAWAVREGLRAEGAVITGELGDAERLAIGTLSPGPGWEAWDDRGRYRVAMMPPWIGGRGWGSGTGTGAGTGTIRT